MIRLSDRQILEAWAEAFTQPYDYCVRNPNADRSKDWTDDNPHYIDIPVDMDTRIKKGNPMIHYIASDGYRSMRIASFAELLNALYTYQDKINNDELNEDNSGTKI